MLTRFTLTCVLISVCAEVLTDVSELNMAAASFLKVQSELGDTSLSAVTVTVLKSIISYSNILL